MKAVILAAGFGSRIRSVTNGTPKCLLRFGGRAILDFQIDSVFQAGVADLAIVVGHDSEAIISHVSRCHADKGGRIAFITNPKFASTNNMYSLALAREWLGGAKFLCLNADVLFHQDILAPAVATRADISVIVDPDFREETTKVIIRDGRVLALSKSISRQDYSGTFVNIATFSSRGAEALFRKAEALFERGETNQFFNDVIGHLIADGASVRFTETQGMPWAEIDDPADLLVAQNHVYPLLVRAVPSGSLSSVDSGIHLPSAVPAS